MQLYHLPKLLYMLKENLSYFYLLFEGKWWIKLMKKFGVEELIGIVEQAHNELVRLRGAGFAWDYRPFYSKLKIHRLFEDPMHTCQDCKSLIRMRPNLKNRVLKKLHIGKYKNANLLLVD